MDISVVLSYHNRRIQLINTLKSISVTSYNSEVEFIIINDASAPDQRIDDIQELFPHFNIKLFNVKSDKKWWINPCVPNNIGFHFASGKIILLQNPECFHMGNVLKYIEDNICENKYLVFGCYAIDPNKTIRISQINSGPETYINEVNKILLPLNNIHISKNHSNNKWYQHSSYNPSALNFCSAIMKSDLDDLGWFDERYAEGIAKDDTEFRLRLRRKGMEVVLVDSPFVLHQHHTPANYGNRVAFAKNTALYQELEKNDVYKVHNTLIEFLVEKVLE